MNFYKLVKNLILIFILITPLFLFTQKVSAQDGRCGANCVQGCATDLGYSCQNGYCWKPASSCQMTRLGIDCGCGGGGDPCAGNTNCGQCGNPPCCSTSSPQASSPISPVNTRRIHNDVAFSWAAIGSWGEGCPTRPSYNLQLKVKSGANCSTGTWNNVYSGGGTSTTINDLQWGTTYCWRVVTSNGGQSNTSAAVEFTTNFAPEARNINFVASTTNKCPANWSGQSDQASTDNPITISIDYYDEDNDFAGGINELKVANLGIVPQSRQNNLIVGQSVLEPHLSATWGAQARGFNAGSYSFALAQTASVNPWGPAQNTGNIESSSAGLLNINGTSAEMTRFVTLSDNKSIRVFWQIKFNDAYPSDMANLYSMVISGPQNNSFELSNDSTPTNLTRYRDIADWGVDVNPPTPNSPVPYNYDPATKRFNIDWVGSDSGSGVNSIRGFCWKDTADNINLQGPSGLITLGTSEPLDNTPNSNCQAQFSGAGNTVNYMVVGSVNNTDDLRFKTVVRDVACNVSVAKDAFSSNPWILSYGGNAHAEEYDFHVPDLSLDNLFRTNASLSSTFASTTGQSYLSTYFASAKLSNPKMPFRNSRSQFVLRGYKDANAHPPLSDGLVDYYNYLWNAATENVSDQIESINPASVVNAGTSSALSATPLPDVAKYYVANGNVSFRSGFLCNTKTAIFVNGHVTINPDFTVDKPDNGCIIIASGNIIVENGVFRSDRGRQISYFDRIDAFLITNGTFLTSPDTQPGAFVGDGLAINGSIISNNFSFNRDLGISNNIAKPAEGIVYDARYSNIKELRDILGIKAFSVRELGYRN